MDSSTETMEIPERVLAQVLQKWYDVVKKEKCERTMSLIKWQGFSRRVDLSWEAKGLDDGFAEVERDFVHSFFVVWALICCKRRECVLCCMCA